MRNLTPMFPLKSKLSGKFQRFNAIIIEAPKISTKMKIYKIFCEAQTASHLKEIIQPPTRYKQNCFTELYRNIEESVSKCFESVVLGRLEMVHCSYIF